MAGSPTQYLTTPSRPLLTTGAIEAVGLSAVVGLMLAVVAVGLAVAAQESEDERAVQVAVGAPPRTLRRVTAVRSLVAVVVAVPLVASLATWAGAWLRDRLRPARPAVFGFGD